MSISGSTTRAQRQQAANIKENIEYYRGDDLFSVAWIGPSVPASDPQAATKLEEIKRIFQAHNVIRELIDNWRNGMISQPFTWYLKGPDGERQEAPEAELALQRWLDWIDQQALEQDPWTTNFHLGDTWAEFVTALAVCGDASLRLWQPERYSDDPDPTHRIHLHAPLAGTIAVERGLDGFIDKIRYSYGEVTEEHYFEGDVLQVQTTDSDNVIQLDTDRRWLIQRICMPPLITDSAKRKQASICHALTMKLRNQELGGFKERTFLNAELPIGDDGEPIQLQRGPGIDQYRYGVQQGENGDELTRPEMVESQPVPVDTFLESIAADRQLLYTEFRQGHLLSTGDAGLAAESRIQMRQNFELYLKERCRPIQSAIANVLTIVLRLLGYSELEAVVKLNVTTGKLSEPERNALISTYQAGLLSKATTMAQLDDVPDIDAELALMDEELEEAMKARPEPLPRNPADDESGTDPGEEDDDGAGGGGGDPGDEA